LLDTQTLLWAATGRRRLSNRVRQALEDPANELFLSAASCWEMAIKASLGKFPITSTDLRSFVEEAFVSLRLVEIPVDRHHSVAVVDLPVLHSDPFDRLLVAQAQVGGLAIVTNDPAIARYDVETIW
jgi:PIN domain nuclease of toxin-antitoxin system